jgi:hypothetical protein
MTSFRKNALGAGSRRVFAPCIRTLGALVACAAALASIAGAAAARTPDYVNDLYLFVAESEYYPTAGAFSLMSVQPPFPHDDCFGALSGDAIPYAYRGLIYVLDRANGNIRVLDPQAEFATLRQFSVGVASNPHDIAFVSEQRAFVTRYETAALWEIDPSTGQHTDTIDLGVLADADGLPEMDKLAIEGDYLYVTLQRLDRDYGWVPVSPALLAVIDLSTNALLDMDPGTAGIQGLPLLGTNPNSGIVVDPQTGDFLIGEAGSFYELDGGIERYDPTTRASLGFAVTEAELGGNLDFWNTADGLTGYGIVLGGSWETAIGEFDLTTGEYAGAVVASSVYAYSHLLIDEPRHRLFVADRTYENPGIRVFDLTTHAPLTSGPIRTCLYPYWFLSMRGPNADVPDRVATQAALAVAAAPQPASSEVALRFTMRRPGAASIEIFDAAGRSVARSGSLALPAGAAAWRWDGRGRDGRAVAPGAYWAWVQTAGGGGRAKIRWVR